MSPEVKVSITITDFSCDPAQVSEHLRVSPTATWRTGDQVGRTARVHKENGWRLRAPQREAASLNDDVEWLLTKLEGGLQTLSNVTGGHYLELACVIYVERETPGLHLEADTLRRLTVLGAHLDIDLYVVSEDPEHA